MRFILDGYISKTAETTVIETCKVETTVVDNKAADNKAVDIEMDTTDKVTESCEVQDEWTLFFFPIE